MKTIPKHLVTVLPRVRSNSANSPRLYSSSNLSLFDSSAPPPSRPVLSSNRLYVEGKPAEVEGSQSSQHHSHSHPPFSLALAQPQSSSGQTLANSNPQGQYALFPYSSLTHPSYPQPHAQQASQDTHTHPRPKRQRLKYQLDVGAYGIPKRCRAAPSSRHHHTTRHPSAEDVGLSVQVGEDAYFVRDNAMGVADGVGGWSKSHSRPTSTPSALFARRLMHYCSAEVRSASRPSVQGSSSPIPQFSPGSGSHLHPPSRPQFSFTHHLRPSRPPLSPPSSSATAWKWSDSSMSSSLPASWTLHDVFSNPSPAAQNYNPFTYPSSEEHYSTAERDYESDLEQDLEDSLEELSEGIDVLQILERAYDKTLKAHVVPDSLHSPPAPPTPRTATTNLVPTTSPSPTNAGEPKPLLAGSSTALLAVLDHPPRSGHASSSSTSAPIPTSTSTSSSSASSSTTSCPIAASVSSAPSPAKSSHPKTTKLPSSSVHSSPPGTDSPKAKKIAQTPLKASTATATTTTPSASSTAVPESTPVECELEECVNEGEYDAVIKIAHVGDCMGMLVRGEEIVWRSEEMWWDFNTPVQLGPSTQSTVTPRNSAMVITIPVKADDILILASDGLSDNLWDEDVLDEVVRFKKSFLNTTTANGTTPLKIEEEREERDDSGYSSSSSIEEPTSTSTEEQTGGMLRRKTLAGMLSEALCSRARRVSERKAASSSRLSTLSSSSSSLSSSPSSLPSLVSSSLPSSASSSDVDEVPFARRAREAGKKFVGGKNDDISVVVAVISPRSSGVD